ncbi:MAG: DUF1549 domain-containing protein [Acidobacteria bacterium]|nr:DUF1549 domain-containing protein [Acidobacteriota bacterium]
MESMIRAVLAMLALILFGLTAAAAPPKAARSDYWAFQTPAPQAVPSNPSPWIRTAVDAFLLDKLQAKNLEPSPELGKQMLVRRLYLDLWGLPPTPEQVDAFVNDRSPRAYEELVERLMASPHYGERWAQKWLDVVRYADTNGFEGDKLRPQAWRYRDYVVRSFTEDKPYDRFVQEQIAGDELFAGDDQALIATGFLRAGPRHVVGGNTDPEMLRQELMVEMTAGVGSAFLGLTVQCARCHDHKFDPILQADYYQLQAFFAPVTLEEVSIASPEEVAAYEQAKAAHEARLEPIQKTLKEMEKPWHDKAYEINKQNLEPALKAALDKPEEQRSEEEKQLASDAKSQAKVAWYDMLAVMPADIKAERAQLRRKLHAIELEAPTPPRAAFAVGNTDKEPPITHILAIGDYQHPLGEVQAEFLSAVPDFGLEVPGGAAGRRAALARWLTHPQHPLTARVMVNRIWQFRMGAALTDDPNNFGLLGAASPSQPELLDYLATQFVDLGWSVKAIDRMIVLSSAYRQAVATDEAKAKIDPDNKLYWRANRVRLSGEQIRDQALAVTGKLNLAVGGEPVLVPIEPEIYDLIFTEGEPDNLWPVTPDPESHHRRSLYLLNKRTVRLPLLANFDQPDTMSSCAVRSRSTHALQSLTLLNSDFIQDASKAFAERLAGACGQDDKTCQAELAWRLSLSRRPNDVERTLAVEFLSDPDTRLQDFCLALLNRNELVYRP